MKKKLLKAAVIAVVLMAAFNIVFPILYIKFWFSGLEITDTESDFNWADTQDLYVLSRAPLMFPMYAVEKDLGCFYKYYTVRDEENDLTFNVGFEMHIPLPLLIPDRSYSMDYKNAAEDIRYRKNIAKSVEKDLIFHLDEYMIVENPCDHSKDIGYHIYVPAMESDALGELLNSLYWSEHYAWRCGYDLNYSLNVCMDEDIYNKIKEADFSSVTSVYKGQLGFKNMLEQAVGCKTVLITSNEGFSKSMYENLGDSSDKNYHPPESFEHLIFYYASEPNLKPDEQLFELYGIDPKK